MSDLQAIAEAAKRAQRVIVGGHVMPDGDCVGAVGALGLALKQLGKEVTMALPDPVPEVYRFLPGAGDFLVGEEALGKDYDTFLVVDCSVPDRLGALRALLERPLVVCSLDHHVSSGCFAAYSYVDPGAAAAAEIVMDLCLLLGAEVTPEIATCLYTGIVADTGSFQYECTTPDTHRRAAWLIEHGAPAVKVNIQLYDEKPLAQIRILEAVLPTLRLSPCGRVAWMSVTRELLEKAAAKDEDVNGLVNYARSVRGVEVALFFREIAPGKYRISFRSKRSVDVNRLAARFGGGGHVRAAGCVLEGDLGALEERVVAAALEAVGA